MKTEKEARQEALSSISTKSMDDLKMVFEKIEMAIDKGEFEICEEISISEQAITKLRELGYTVNTDSHRNEFYTTIKW